MSDYTYLLLNIGTILFPVLFSFEKQIRFVRFWPAVIPGILLTGSFFLIWDYLFTLDGVWGFNPVYLTKFYMGPLPVEEILFFITVPFACLFIYELVKFYLPDLNINKQAQTGFTVLGIALLLIGLFNTDKAYTFIKLSLTGGGLLFATLMMKPKWLGHFLVMFLVHLIPFFIVNGILTSLPVVWYNDAENLGIRMGTIPVEDTFYSLLLLLMNVAFFEYFRGKISSTQRRRERRENAK
ncbi:MAG: lycopene cyclase domain-containing protein [Bacteroidetes bacterium]|nr:lycopene cyclase domain-containing protein [Bacteroidota bacterium]